VLRTKLYNNTVYLTGMSSQGFVCGDGCSSDVLTMRNNIIQAVLKVGYADAPFDENNDLFYGGVLQFTKGSSSIVANPQFVDPASANFHLQASSPAIDGGADLGFAFDFDGLPVPVDGNGDGLAKADMGAFEGQVIGDTTAPTAPVNLIATATSSSQVDLVWDASNDDVGVTGYELRRDGVLVATTAAFTSYFDMNVTAGATYTYEVRARDAAGNVSGPSNAATATVPAL